MENYVNIFIEFVLILVGVYSLAGTVKMKRESILSRSFLPRWATEDKCLDKTGFIRFMFPRQLLFSLLCIADGVLNILQIQYGFLESGFLLVVVFVGVIFWFCSVVKSATKKFFTTQLQQ